MGFSSLFLAAAGNYNNGSLNNEGDNGNYWSSTPNDANNAWNLNFNNGNINTNNNNRNNGFPVRPVQHLPCLLRALFPPLLNSFC